MQWMQGVIENCAIVAVIDPCLENGAVFFLQEELLRYLALLIRFMELSYLSGFRITCARRLALNFCITPLESYPKL